MRVKFTKLEPAASVIEIPDPFGEGWRLQVYRYDSDEHQRYLRERKADEVTEEALRRLAAATTAPKKPAAEGEEPTNGAAPADFVGFYQQVTHEYLEAKRIDYRHVFGAPQRLREMHLEEAVHLLRGWSDIPSDDGSDILVSDESKRELLTYPDFVPEGQKYAGSTIGAALVAHIFEQSRAAMKQATEVAEAAEGNSEQSAAGAQSGGLS